MTSPSGLEDSWAVLEPLLVPRLLLELAGEPRDVENRSLLQT